MREYGGGNEVSHSKEPEATCLSVTGEMDRPNGTRADDGQIRSRQKPYPGFACITTDRS